MKVPQTDEILERIASYPDAKTSIEYAEKNCYGSTYLVGGKVYRTVIEMMTGKDVGARTADWDFLCMGEIKIVRNPPRGWRRNVFSCSGSRPGYARRSIAVVSPRPVKNAASKIDLVSMADVMRRVGFAQSTDINDYLRAVPLDIQAIAIGPMPRAVMRGTRAIDAIRKQKLSVNNTNGKILAIPMQEYISKKAESLGFVYSGAKTVAKIPCNCFPNDTRMLWEKGCQAPGLHC